MMRPLLHYSTTHISLDLGTTLIAEWIHISSSNRMTYLHFILRSHDHCASPKWGWEMGINFPHWTI